MAEAIAYSLGGGRGGAGRRGGSLKTQIHSVFQGSFLFSFEIFFNKNHPPSHRYPQPPHAAYVKSLGHFPPCPSCPHWKYPNSHQQKLETMVSAGCEATVLQLISPNDPLFNLITLHEPSLHVCLQEELVVQSRHRNQKKQLENTWFFQLESRLTRLLPLLPE